ncbi:hypothetical protein GCM10010946_30070 [Undibacterium squillarum]|uniref:Uncharacterized protein n=1 Tax=Undibacterium squillarum TaxID=1131567 RepID=A0ABQ2Y1P3_9BURK|nr:hypothetical protein GCM10010946_30070 [Undibacterium squillarum]
MNAVFLGENGVFLFLWRMSGLLLYLPQKTPKNTPNADSGTPIRRSSAESLALANDQMTIAAQ